MSPEQKPAPKTPKPKGGVKRKPSAATLPESDAPEGGGDFPSAAGMSPKQKPAPKTPKPKGGVKRKPSAATLPESDAPEGGGVGDEEKAEAALRCASTLKEPEWKAALEAEFAKDYFLEVAAFVEAERAAHLVHPAPDKVFEALNVTALSKVRVVILGQDPYHEPGQAHGLCFSVLPGVKPPPSLKNMYKELRTDIPGFEPPEHGYLLSWAQQGVLMLNATLTVRGGHTEANSHAKCGWQRFTDEVIRVLNERREGVVFLLWGGFAQKKGAIVDASRHKVIACAHPSPLSFRKWTGCKTFSRCNEALKALGKEEIDWKLPAEVSEPSGEAPKVKKQKTIDMLFGTQ